MWGREVYEYTRFIRDTIIQRNMVYFIPIKGPILATKKYCILDLKCLCIRIPKNPGRP